MYYAVAYFDRGHGAAGDTMKLIGLIRVSTAKQSGIGGEGLQRQRDAIAAIAAREGVAPADVTLVEVADVSGSDLAMTDAWQKVVLPAIADPDTHIACDTDDRLARVDKYNMTALEDLYRTKTKVYLPSGVRDLVNNHGDYLIQGLMALLGGLDKKSINHKTTSGKEARRKSACWVGAQPPIGIRVDRQDPSNPKSPRNVWGLTADAPKVAEAFRMYGVDRASLTQVAALLGMDRTSIHAVMTNDLYRGWLIYDRKLGDREYKRKSPGQQPARARVKRDAETVIQIQVFGLPGQPAAIVTDELWATVQGRIATQAKSHQRSREMSTPLGWLSGTLRADEAKATSGIVPFDVAAVNMHYMHHARRDLPNGRGEMVRYVCHCGFKHFKGQGRCNVGAPTADMCNTAVDRYLADLTTNPKTLVDIGANIDTAGQPDNERQRLDLQTRLNKITAREGIALTAYLDGDLPKADYHARKTKLADERREVESALEGMATPPALPDAVTLADLGATWAFDPSWTPDKKRAWLRRYVAAIDVSRDGIESVLFRLPVAGGGVVFYGHVQPARWVDLAPNASNAVRADQLAEAMGISRSYLRDLINMGKVPGPTLATGVLKAWLPADAERITAAWLASRAK